MRRKREEARRAAENRRREAEARAEDEARRQAAQARARAAAEEVIVPLRLLGFRAEEARRAATLCETIPEASLEERLRLALAHLRPPQRRVLPAAT